MAQGMNNKDMIAFAHALLKIRDDYKEFIRRFMLEIGMRTIAQTKALTPVDTGDLRDRWELGEVVIEGGFAYVNIINSMNYASFVEDGHIQRSRWVPGAWHGDSFVYDPTAKTGMKLQTKWIPGQHMARISLMEIERQLPARYDKAFKALLARGGLK